MKKFITENLTTIFYALVIAVIIRSFLIQPFYIPSSSMEPSLLVGDRLFVTKYSYGYSKHSLPFSPPIFKGRLIQNNPERGDVIVFKTPADDRTDYIKRLVGLPGDRIQFIGTNLYINNSEIVKSLISKEGSGSLSGHITEATTTGPNKQPLPASSIPNSILSFSKYCSNIIEFIIYIIL